MSVSPAVRQPLCCDRADARQEAREQVAAFHGTDESRDGRCKQKPHTPRDRNLIVTEDVKMERVSMRERYVAKADISRIKSVW